MNANYHPYHYTPLIDLTPDSRLVEFRLYGCTLELGRQLLIENVPVYFTSVLKGARFLERKKTEQIEFHSKLFLLEELPDTLILDPCASCGFYEVQKKERITDFVTIVQMRIVRLKELSLRLFRLENYPDSFLVLKNLLNHLDPADAEAHYTLGLIGLATGDQALVDEARQSLQNIDLKMLEKLMNCK